MLHRLIETEIYKLKGNKTFLITALGAILLPILYAILSITMGKDLGLDFKSAFYSMNGIYIGIFSVIFATVIVNYLFTIDTKTHTLKSIIPLPVNMRTYMISKIIVLLIWMISLSLITIIAGSILFPLSGISGFSYNTLITYGSQSLYGTFLLFLLMTPIIFITVATRNTTASLIISVILMFFNLAIDSIPKLAYCPWTIPEKMASKALTIPSNKAWIIIIATAVIGYILTRYTLNKRDITL